MPLLAPFQAMLDAAAAAGQPESHTLTIEEIRAANLAIIPSLGNPEPVGRTEDREIEGPVGKIPIRLYWPEGAGPDPLPVLITLHGGGMIAGNIDVFDTTNRAITNRVGCLTISVNYRLAPENKFPVPLEDCYAVAVWAAGHAAEFGGDPARLAVLGESAGGNLAAALAFLTRDRGGPHLACQVLVYPLLDYPDPGSKSMQELGEGYGLSRKDIRMCLELYLGQEADKQNPYFLPLKASNLQDLAPALVITAEYDPLRDDGEEYAERLKAAGVPVLARRYDGVLHGFYILTTLTEPSNRAIEDTAATLRNAFSPAKVSK